MGKHEFSTDYVKGLVDAGVADPFNGAADFKPTIEKSQPTTIVRSNSDEISPQPAENPLQRTYIDQLNEDAEALLDASKKPGLLTINDILSRVYWIPTGENIDEVGKAEIIKTLDSIADRAQKIGQEVEDSDLQQSALRLLTTIARELEITARLRQHQYADAADKLKYEYALDLADDREILNAFKILEESTDHAGTASIIHSIVYPALKDAETILYTEHADLEIRQKSRNRAIQIIAALDEYYQKRPGGEIPKFYSLSKLAIHFFDKELAEQRGGTTLAPLDEQLQIPNDPTVEDQVTVITTAMQKTRVSLKPSDWSLPGELGTEDEPGEITDAEVDELFREVTNDANREEFFPGFTLRQADESVADVPVIPPTPEVTVPVPLSVEPQSERENVDFFGKYFPRITSLFRTGTPLGFAQAKEREAAARAVPDNGILPTPSEQNDAQNPTNMNRLARLLRSQVEKWQ